MSRRAVLPLLMLAAGTLAACAPGGAARSAFRAGEVVAVLATETIEGDLYATGTTVTIDGSVRGDVYAAGSAVTLNGRVAGDFVAAGGQVALNGPVDGDVRLGAGSVTMSSRVGEDALVAAGTIALAAGAQVGGDLIVQAGQLGLAGDVKGSVLGEVGQYSRTGSVGGKDQIVIRPPEERPVRAERRAEGDLAAALRQLLSILLVGAVIAYRWPAALRSAAGRMRREPLAVLGWGVVAWAAAGVAIVALTIAWIVSAIALGSLTLAGLAGLVAVTGLLADAAAIVALVITGMLLTWIVTGVAAGEAIVRATMTRDMHVFVPLAIGATVLVALGALPVVGTLVTLVVTFAGAGLLALAAYGARRGATPPPAANQPG